MFASNYIPSLQMRYEGFTHLHFAYFTLSDMLEFNKLVAVHKRPPIFNSHGFPYFRI